MDDVFICSPFFCWTLAAASAKHSIANREIDMDNLLVTLDGKGASSEWCPSVSSCGKRYFVTGDESHAGPLLFANRDGNKLGRET